MNEGSLHTRTHDAQQTCVLKSERFGPVQTLVFIHSHNVLPFRWRDLTQEQK